MLSLVNSTARESALVECSFAFGVDGPATARDEGGAPVRLSRGMCLAAASLVGPTPSGAVMYLGRSETVDGPLATTAETTRFAGAAIATGARARIAETALSSAPYVTAVMRGAPGARILARLTVEPADPSVPVARARATEPVEFAPPTLGGTEDPARARKRRFGSWMGLPLQVLARLRCLRGTPFDPFGRTHERRSERALIDEYRSQVESVLAGLCPESLERALAVARVPDTIRGFGHVKEASVRQAWAAVHAGRTLADAARDAPELRDAIAFFGG